MRRPMRLPGKGRMMLRRMLILATVLATSAGAAPDAARAQARIRPDPTPRLPPQPGQGLGVEDARSLQRAARLSDAQVEAGHMGAEKAADAEVRQLAASIAEDHTHFRRTLGELAVQHRVELQGREAAGIEDRSLTALGGMTGHDFDRAFVERQLQLYPRMAELYQTMASNSPEPALARFGITALAALRRHFETAKALGTRFGLSTGTSGNPPQY